MNACNFRLLVTVYSLITLFNSQSSGQTTQRLSANKHPASAPTERIVEEWQESQVEFSPLRAVARLVNDKIDGECRFFTKTGRLYKVETYKAGILHGSLTRYYPDGKKYFVAQFREGLVIENRHWYPDGILAQSIEYANGAPNGGQITYFANGHKCVEAMRVNGLAQGKRNHYLPDGRLFAVSDWRDDQQVSQRIVDERVTRDDLAETSQVSEFLKLRQRDFWSAEAQKSSFKHKGPDPNEPHANPAQNSTPENDRGALSSPGRCILRCSECGGDIALYDSYEVATSQHRYHDHLTGHHAVVIEEKYLRRTP